MEENTRGHDSAPLIGKAGIAYALLSVITLFILGKLQGPALFFKTEGSGYLLGPDPLAGALKGLAVGAMLAVSGEFLTRFTEWGRALMKVMRLIIGRPHFFDVVLMALLSALGEELVFRGLAMPYFGLIGSSAIFGLVHLIPRKRLWVWSVWATGAGLIFGYLAQATGGLLAPFAAHFLVNAVGLSTLAYRKTA